MKLYISTLFAVTSFCIHSNAQISVTTVEKKEPEKKVIIAPEYDSLEAFVSYNSYYRTHWRIPNDEKCTVEEFYKRYVGLQIYYPSYSNEFNKTSTIFFTVSNPLKYLTWEEVGDKYYTILKIHPSLDKTQYYDCVKKDKNIGLGLSGALLLELKDETTGEVIYSVESDYSNRFILVPYFVKRQQLLKNNTLVATDYISARMFPNVDEFLRVNEKSELSGEFTLIRSEVLGKSNNPDSDESVILVYLLKNKENTFILFNDSQRGRPVFSDVITFKDDLQKQESRKIAEEKARVDGYVKKYGAEYGKLVAKNQVKIGMTKQMCEDAWGTTFDKKRFTDSAEEKEI
ncbi:MAG: hypothetical protein PHW92_13545, partial [Lutibacter sp.]|nr:hypothetical protein [Lutibacter sp.]